MNDLHAALGQFRCQRPHGQIGFFGQTRQQPIPGLTLQSRRAMPPNLAGNLPATGTLALPDPNRRRHRHPEPLRSPTNRLALSQSRRDPHPEINRQW